MPSQLSRRLFIKKNACLGAVAAGAWSAASYARIYGANDRLHIASVGVGGKGQSDLEGVAASPHVHVAALCDIDSSAKHLGQAAESFPQAKTYQDWRTLLDEAKSIDGVIVSTPDFMHAPIAMSAMHLGKHVFCQKPLAHTVFEARQMRRLAEQKGLVTQMGNQIQSHEAYRTAVKYVHDGLIGKVSEVHSWQGNSPRWPRAIERPSGSDPVPAHVRWDLWQGVAEERPFKLGFYHPFSWRGWQAYGTGQLGDFGCHILDPVFMSLQLSSPTKLTGVAPAFKPESWTDRATVRYEFPGTKYTVADTLPVTWYDAVDVLPPRERLTHLPSDYELPGAGSVLVGEKGSLLIPHVKSPVLFPQSQYPADQLETVSGVDHYVQWADACRGVGKTTSNFSYAGPLAEAVLLGTIAIRFPNTELHWDAHMLQLTNSDAAQAFVSKSYRKGWEPAWV